MNLRWLKRNLVAVIFVSVYVLLLGGIIWMEQMAAKSRTEVEADLSNLNSELERLRKLQVYPSRDNIQLLQAQRAEVQNLYDTLQQTATRGGVDVTNSPNEISFVDSLRRTQAELYELAKKNNVMVESNFAFGFSRYAETFPCRNPAAKPEECSRILAALAKEVAVVHKLTTLMATNGVDSIITVRRVEVEPLGTSGFGGDTLPGPLPEDPRARYRIMPFDLVFTTGAKALQTFLNSLAQSDWFFMVESTTINAKYVPANAPTPGTPAPGSIPRGAAKSQHKPMLVTMRVDLVEFPNTKPTK